MLREILDDTFALFSISGFRKTVARGCGSRSPAIARLEFLRSRIRLKRRSYRIIVCAESLASSAARSALGGS
jgi:hypothetical protein